MKKIKKFNESKKSREIKTISEMIEYLEDIMVEEGNINVCHSESHEYWGSVESWLIVGYNLSVSEHAQPDGPKSGRSVRALVFGGR